MRGTTSNNHCYLKYLLSVCCPLSQPLPLRDQVAMLRSWPCGFDVHSQSFFLHACSASIRKECEGGFWKVIELKVEYGRMLQSTLPSNPTPTTDIPKFQAPTQSYVHAFRALPTSAMRWRTGSPGHATRRCPLASAREGSTVQEKIERTSLRGYKATNQGRSKAGLDMAITCNNIIHCLRL